MGCIILPTERLPTLFYLQKDCPNPSVYKRVAHIPLPIKGISHIPVPPVGPLLLLLQELDLTRFLRFL